VHAEASSARIVLCSGLVNLFVTVVSSYCRCTGGSNQKRRAGCQGGVLSKGSLPFSYHRPTIKSVRLKIGISNATVANKFLCIYFCSA
jgi:hypothetical protein